MNEIQDIYKITIKFKRDEKELCNMFVNAVLTSKLKIANIISAEMLSSMYHDCLWYNIFLIYIEYINIKNYETITYLKNNYIMFSKITPKEKMKNNQIARNIISQVVSILCLIPKKKIKSDFKRKKNVIDLSKTTFDKTNIKYAYPAIYETKFSDNGIKKLKTEMTPTFKWLFKYIGRNSHHNCNNDNDNKILSLVIYISLLSNLLSEQKKQNQSKFIKKAKLNSDVIKLNMWINILYQGINNGHTMLELDIEK